MPAYDASEGEGVTPSRVVSIGDSSLDHPAAT